MAATIFVTGATGQTGGNVCEQLIERGDHVRALVRNPDTAAALSAIGVELIKGDISDADDVRRAAKDVRKPRTADNLTTRRLGYDPMSFDDGLRLLIPWLRELGRLE